jgi:hypothetical protein
VSLGGTLGDAVEALSGVHPGERVVLHPSQKLQNGTAVTRKER